MTELAAPAQRDRIEAMFLALQLARITFVSTVMQLRYASEKAQSRILRRAVIAFLRLQRLSEAAAALLDTTEASA